MKDKFGEEIKIKTPLSDNFAFPKLSNSGEEKKLRMQEKCEHVKYTIRCAQCSKVLGSEVLHTLKKGNTGHYKETIL